jgi:hypothetical protein
MYPPVKILNTTQHHASGRIEFAAPNICGASSYRVNAGERFTDKGRGLCLLKTITATLSTPDGSIEATPYRSSGTAYSDFAIIQDGALFKVTRVVNEFEDERPAGVGDPTTEQR